MFVLFQFFENISRIIFDIEFFQQIPVFIKEGALLVMGLLILYVFDNIGDL